MSYILDALKKAEAETSPDVRAALAIEQDGRRRQRILGYVVLVALLVNAVVLIWLFFPGTDSSATVDQGGAGANNGAGYDATATSRPAGNPLVGTTMDPEAAEASAPGPPASSPREPVREPEPDPEPTGGSATLPNRQISNSQLATEPLNARAAPPATPAPSRSEAPDAAQGLVIGPDYRAASAAAKSATGARSSVTLADLPTEVAARLPDLEYSTHIYGTLPSMRAVVINGQRLTEGDQIRGVTLSEITEEGVVLDFERYLIAVPVLIDWDD